MDNSMLQQFADFAASKPADEEYLAGVPSICALGQFCGVMGWEPFCTGYRDASGEFHNYDDGAFAAAMDANAAISRGLFTFGALSERLSARLSQAALRGVGE